MSWSTHSVNRNDSINEFHSNLFIIIMTSLNRSHYIPLAGLSGNDFVNYQSTTLDKSIPNYNLNSAFEDRLKNCEYLRLSFKIHK